MADVADLFISIGLLIFLIIGILLSILIRSVASSGAQKVGGKFGRRRNIEGEDDSMGFLGSLAILGIVGILFVAFKDELVTIMPSTVTSESFLILGVGFLVIAIVLIFLAVK